MAHRSMNPNVLNRVSVRGVGLAGMAAWGDNASSGVVATPGLKKALTLASTSLGCIKMTIEGLNIVGSKIRVTNSQTWGEKLNTLAEHVVEGEPVYFALFTESKQCLIVTYVPDLAKPYDKMLYASSKNAVKDAIIELDEDCELQEFNVSDKKELNYEEFQKRQNAPKPFSEAEIQKQELAQMETGGAYGALATIMAMEKKGKASMINNDVMEGDKDAKPFALPGFAELGEKGFKGLLKKKRERKEKVQEKPKEKSTETEKKVPALVPVLPVAMAKEAEVKDAEAKPEKKEFSNVELLEVLGTNDPELQAKVEEKKEEKEAELVEASKLLKEVAEASPSHEETIIIKAAPGYEEANDNKTEEESNLTGLLESLDEDKTLEKNAESEQDDKDDEEENEVSKLKIEEPKILIPEHPETQNDTEILDNLENEAATLEQGDSSAVVGSPPVKRQNSNVSASAAAAALTKLGRKVGSKGKTGFKSVVSGLALKTEGMMRRFNSSRGVQPKLSEEQLTALDDTDGFATLAELKEMKRANNFGDYDPKTLEQYLSTQSFTRTFKMSKEAFYAQPKWKQDKMKKKEGLF